MMTRASAVICRGATVLVSVGAGRPTVTVVPPTPVTAIAVSNARELPAASMTTSALTPAASASAGPYTSAAPSSRARSRFPATASIPITFPWPSDTRGDERGHADSAEPDDDDGVAVPGLPGVDHCPTPGEHGAAEHRRNLRWHVVADRDQGAPVDHGVVGERGDTEMVMNRLSAQV